jgi:hypothetical protein
MLLAREHVHRAALALGITALAPGQLGHHALRVHAAGQHVAVVAIGGDHLVALLHRHFHADDDRFLADIKMAEPADVTHAVKLARLLLEAADQQHVLIGLEVLILGEGGIGFRVRFAGGFLGSFRHAVLSPCGYGV